MLLLNSLWLRVVVLLRTPVVDQIRLAMVVKYIELGGRLVPDMCDTGPPVHGHVLKKIKLKKVDMIYMSLYENEINSAASIVLFLCQMFYSVLF